MTDTEMNGKVRAIDLSGRVLTTVDESLATHVYTWNTEALDEYFKKAFVGGYQTVKFDPDTYLIKSAHYWPEGKDKKEIWARLRDQKPAWTGSKPTNTKMIAAQVLLKAYCDLWVHTNTPDQVLFNDAREDIRKAVEEDLVWLLRVGGA